MTEDEREDEDGNGGVVEMERLRILIRESGVRLGIEEGGDSDADADKKKSDDDDDERRPRSILSPELQAELGSSGGGGGIDNALVLPPRKKRRAAGVSSAKIAALELTPRRSSRPGRTGRRR